MATKEEIRRKNKQLRIFKAKSKRVLGWIRNIVVSTLLLTIVFIGVVTGVHFIQTNNEIKTLSSAGLYHKVTVEGNREMNVAFYGNKESEHTIVPISGVGIQDLTVFVQHMTATIKDNVGVAMIDRAGYGFSDDSTKDQTVEQIISDYRTALKNANIEAPYLLLAHEFGGVYATYWAANYPDEIEGIIYLDGAEMTTNTQVSNQEASFKDLATSYLYKIGFQRMVYYDFYNHSAMVLTEQEAACSRALNVHSVNTRAYLSEISLMKDNLNKTIDCMEKARDIPKAYVSSKNSFTTQKDVIKYYEYRNAQNEEKGLPPFYKLTDNVDQVSKDSAQFIADCAERYEKETKPFVEALGNCQLTRMPGDGRIYEHKPEGLIDVVKDFMLYLDGKRLKINEFYDDTKVINWENFKEEHTSTTQPTDSPNVGDKDVHE
jgi:pimeloyl-ACP methyl ester carboxylesterase